MNLIITPTGKNSYFKKWIKDDCNFDIVLLCYEDIEEYKHTNIKHVKHFNTEKWPMSKRFIVENVNFTTISAVLSTSTFVSTGTARPNIKSPEQDKVIDGVNFITRYVYSGNLTGEREFCNKMLNADKVYRKEDIIAMESEAVNPGFGKGGAANYSVWFFKGGPRCEHKWLRRTYANLEGVKVDPTNPSAKPLSNRIAEQYGYRIRNEKEVSMKPADMPRKGYTKEYWDKMGFKN